VKKQKSKYQGNKKILADEASYPDHHTVLLIDILVEIAVETTLAKAKALYDVIPPPPPPDLSNTPLSELIPIND